MARRTRVNNKPKIKPPEPKKKEKKERKKETQTNAICFTINNYSLDEELLLLCHSKPITYVIFGYEVGKDKGTAHIQGYMESSYSMRFTTWKRTPGLERAHIEPRKGSQKQAIDYCKKDGNFIEWGEKRKSVQGQRFDLDECRAIADTEGMKEVVVGFNLQQIRTAEKYLQYRESPRQWKPCVTWIYGKTGTGKSRIAHQMYPNAYTKSDSSKWFDGYDAHEDVIFDDFRANWMKFNDLLTILDRYECKVEVKGGMRQFKPRNIIITSSKHPKDVYNVDDRVDQLLRRIDFIEKLSSPEAIDNMLPLPGEVEGGNTIHPLDFGITKLSFD